MAHNQTIQVEVSWREIPILSDVALEVEEEGAFMPTSSPMPVGTMLIVTPIQNREVSVPARITQIQEMEGAKRTGAFASQSGMRLIFDTAWEHLLEYAGESTAVDPKPEPESEVAAEPSFDEESVPVGPNLSENSGEYIEIVTITSPEQDDQDVKDSGLAPQASGEIQLDATGLGSDPEAPDKVIIDVTEVPAPQPGTTPEEDDLEADAEEEIETAVERPSGLRAAEEEEAEEEGEGKKRKRRRGRGKRGKKKR